MTAPVLTRYPLDAAATRRRRRRIAVVVARRREQAGGRSRAAEGRDGGATGARRAPGDRR